MQSDPSMFSSPYEVVLTYLKVICDLMSRAQEPITTNGIALRLGIRQINTMLAPLAKHNLVTDVEQHEFILLARMLDRVEREIGQGMIYEAVLNGTDLDAILGDSDKQEQALAVLAQRALSRDISESGSRCVEELLSFKVLQNVVLTGTVLREPSIDVLRGGLLARTLVRFEDDAVGEVDADVFYWSDPAGCAMNVQRNDQIMAEGILESGIWRDRETGDVCERFELSAVRIVVDVNDGAAVTCATPVELHLPSLGTSGSSADDLERARLDAILEAHGPDGPE
jgi:hypothetical protein